MAQSSLIRITPNDTAFVSDKKLMQRKDFFYKGKKKNVTQHDYSMRTMIAVDVFSSIWVAYLKAQKPIFREGVAATMRYPDDASYKAGSYHGKGRAADLNWDNNSVEREIVLITGYDIAQKGIIYELFVKLGINGVGTYFENDYGTFIHLDDRDTAFTHYQNLPKKQISSAAESHKRFMDWVQKDPKAKSIFSNTDKYIDYSKAIDGDSSIFQSDNEEDALPLEAKIFKWIAVGFGALAVGALAYFFYIKFKK